MYLVNQRLPRVWIQHDATEDHCSKSPLQLVVDCPCCASLLGIISGPARSNRRRWDYCSPGTQAKVHRCSACRNDEIVGVGIVDQPAYPEYRHSYLGPGPDMFIQIGRPGQRLYVDHELGVVSRPAPWPASRRPSYARRYRCCRAR